MSAVGYQTKENLGAPGRRARKRTGFISRCVSFKLQGRLITNTKARKSYWSTCTSNKCGLISTIVHTTDYDSSLWWRMNIRIDNTDLLMTSILALARWNNAGYTSIVKVYPKVVLKSWRCIWRDPSIKTTTSFAWSRLWKLLRPLKEDLLPLEILFFNRYCHRLWKTATSPSRELRLILDNCKLMLSKILISKRY